MTRIYQRDHVVVALRFPHQVDKGTAAGTDIVRLEQPAQSLDSPPDPAMTSAKPSVSVAYVVPIPPPGTDDDVTKRLSGDLMGVAVAQRQANRTNTLGDRPPIRVLIANVGDSSELAKEPIDRLVEMAHADSAERLVAVAVSGQPLEPPTEAIDTLLAAQVPVIASSLTADRLTSTSVASDAALARIAPTVSDEVAAAVAYLHPSSARVVTDL